MPPIAEVGIPDRCPCGYMAAEEGQMVAHWLRARAYVEGRRGNLRFTPERAHREPLRSPISPLPERSAGASHAARVRRRGLRWWLVAANLGAMAFALSMQALYEAPAIWRWFEASRGPYWGPALLVVALLFALPDSRRIGLWVLTRVAIVAGLGVLLVSCLGLLVLWVLSWPWPR